MQSSTLDQSSRLVSGTSWAAIARGVFVALALQTLLLLFGAAVVGSVGDRVAESGFALWVVLVFLISFAIGGAIAGAGRSESRGGGLAAGFMVWAVAIVLGNAVGHTLVGPERFSPLWTPFIAALLSLGAAVIGGALGAGLRGGARRSPAIAERDSYEYQAREPIVGGPLP